MDVRPRGRRKGRTVVPLRHSDLHVPPHPPHPQDSLQDQGGESDRSLDRPPLASLPLVGAGEGHDDSPAPGPPPSQVHSQDQGGRANEGVPGPTNGLAGFRSNLAKTYEAHGLSEDDLEFLSHHISSGSASGYSYIWAKFSTFCSNLEVDPFSCSPIIILKFLRSMFDNGAKYRTINHARSAISKLHFGINGKPAGQHPLVSQAVRSAFRQRPPLPKYRTTFDVKPVFTYIKQILGNNDILTLRMLTFKCLYLVSFSSIARISTLSILAANVEQHPDHIVVPLLSLEKQARGRHEIFISIYNLMYLF